MSVLCVNNYLLSGLIIWTMYISAQTIIQTT